MSYTFGQITTNIRTNLNDAGVTFFSEDDINDSLQDSYDDICAVSQCNLQIADQQQWPVVVYINPVSDLGLSNYLGTVAIFNYATNRWLFDDLNIRDFDRIRRDWELWQGTPLFWAPSDPLHIAIAPTYQAVNSINLFKFVYYAQAPTITDFTNQVSIVATDVQDLHEFYVTADLMEQAQEYNKASGWWSKYDEKLTEYSERVKKSNRADLLLRI
jgi:hypothetical protein